jgi:hypothetical protein
MSGQNNPVLDIPPGVVRNGTPYVVGRRWWDVNWVRWIAGQLTPIGGWVKGRLFGDVATGSDVVRDTFSWRDNLKNPWYAVGTEKTLQAASPNPAISLVYTITPAGLISPAPAKRGYGSGLYGDFPYGQSPPVISDAVGQWSMDNFGRYLMAVHSQDGRLFSWDPANPSVVAEPVVNAPTDNTLVIVTDERMVMVLGGKNNPRRVKWSDRENMTSWTPTATNTAGGFELNSQGAIIAAVRVQGGILVLTEVDAHIIEYIGAPFYYGRRRLSEEVGCASKNALVGVTGMAFWLSKEGFWRYDGNVTPVASPVDQDILRDGDLSNPPNVFLGYNGFNREVWTFYPSKGSSKPNSYVFISIANEPYWSKGKMTRTAFMNPVWDTKPVMWNGRQEYFHEVGLLADGASRVADIYAETGEFGIGEGDQNMRVDRIYPDGLSYNPASGTTYTTDYELTIKLRQAPSAAVRTVGPISLQSPKGYEGVRFRARSMQVKVTPVADTIWALGRLRMRMKAGGAR